MLLINKTLIRMSEGIRGWIAIITGLKILTLVGTVMFAKTISSFLSDLYQPKMSQEQLLAAIISALIASCLILIADLLTGEAEYRCGAKARINLRKEIFEKMLQLDVGKIERIGASNTISSVGDGVELMQVYYTKYLPSLLYCFFAPVYLFFQLKDTSLLVATILLIISLSLPLVNNYFRKMIDQLKKEYWTSFQDLTSYYLESLKSLVTLKLFNQDRRRHDNLRRKADTFNQSTMSIMKMNFSSFLVSDGLIYLGVILAVVIGCSQLAKGTIDLAQAVLLLMLSYSFFSSIRQLMSATHDALSGIAATIKVDEILNLDASRIHKSEAETAHEIAVKYSQDTLAYLQDYSGIIVKDIVFNYHQRRQVLKQLSIEIPKGKTTAIVGKSGCGKSASTSELLNVLKQVHLYQWLQSLPEGLSTDLGDSGAKLSGGQRQKIGIARALLSGAPYLIFDEATSSVDRDSEDEIWQCINELGLTRTLIIISHRLSTIQRADNIIVLNQGRLVEQGNHQALLKYHGEYYQLVKEQEALEAAGKVG